MNPKAYKQTNKQKKETRSVDNAKSNQDRLLGCLCFKYPEFFKEKHVLFT